MWLDLRKSAKSAGNKNPLTAKLEKVQNLRSQRKIRTDTEVHREAQSDTE
jgi:hypothetical protein